MPNTRIRPARRIAGGRTSGYDNCVQPSRPISQSPILVRPAGRGDADTIVAFNRKMALETEGRDLPASVARDGVLAALSDRSRAAYYVAEVADRIGGQAMVTTEWSDWRNGLFWWIQSVYVVPEFRRRGVFRALHEFIRDQARRRGDVCGLRLYVHHENRIAIETYQRLGMQQTDYLLLEEDWSARGRS